MRSISLLACLLLLLAGCADSPDSTEAPPAGEDEVPDDEDSMEQDPTNETEPTPPPENETQEPSPPREPVTWNLDIQGNDFVSGSITVQVGDTVTWTQRDSVPHTVTSDDGESFHSGDCPGPFCMSAANPTFSHTFDQVGEFPYHCEVHPGMQDTISAVARYDEIPS